MGEESQISLAARRTKAVRRGLHACKFQQSRGPHEDPAQRFSWGEEKETERCET